MKFISQVIRHLNVDKIDNELIGSEQLRTLLRLIESGEIRNEEEGRIALLGKEGNRQAFKQARLRLRDKLLEHVAHESLELKKIDLYARRYIRCWNQIVATKSLIVIGDRSSAVELAEVIIRTTQKFEYTELTLTLSRDVYYYYSTINYDAKKAKRFKEIMLSTSQLFERELESSQYYNELRAVFITSLAPKRNKVQALAMGYAEKLRPYLYSKNISYQLIINVYNVIAMRYEIVGDYFKLIEISDEAIGVLNKRIVTRRLGYFQFDLYKIVAFIQLREYQSAEQIADAHLKLMTVGLLNWVVLKIYVIVSGLHSKRYDAALETIVQLTTSKSSTKIPDHIIELINVYEAYIEFLIAVGKVKREEPSKFRVNKFLNEIPIFTKDKRGLNIAILIIHVLFLLQQRKYSQIIDRVDALKQYCYRYLRKDDTFRSHCFIRMLLQMPKADFNRIRTERYAESYVKKLQSEPLMISEQSIEVEVIPYEDLWGMTLDLLD